jgi:mutual gliding-motility protein MglA
MVQINFALKEVSCKIVYYGPGLSGKTTNLEVLHQKIPSAHVGQLTSIATEGDRTLFFDFLPLSLGQVAGMTTKFQIYTVPGQVYYNSTRRLVLQGADGVVFVADSRRKRLEENLESLANLEENLRECGKDFRTIPTVFQYNKRDLPDIHTVEELEQKLNKYQLPYFEAVAFKGDGVFPTLRKLAGMVLEDLNRQQKSTAVRRPAKENTSEPVSVGVGGGRARMQAASGVDTRSPIQQHSTIDGRQAGTPNLTEERVTEHTEIKPIKRHTPAPSASRQSADPPWVARNRPSARFPKSREDEGQRKWPMAAVGVIIITLLCAVAIYMSGVWKQFLG